ncbi:MAG: hypothetical protein EBR84_01015 [Actinobacteria bacterium]|nr:hypothetical protein [Actinomycetota bacterium]
MVAITVVGEVVLDCVVSNGETEKVSGGCAANQALALARLGAVVQLRARYSTDENGRFLKQFIIDQGVGVQDSIDASEPALVITITKDQTGHPTFNYGELVTCADWYWTESEISRPLPSGTQAILTGSMASVFPPGAEVLLKWAQEQKNSGVTICYDLNIRSGSFFHFDEVQLRANYQGWLNLADIVKVSDEDLSWWAPSTDPIEVARDLSTFGSSKLVALTQGASGASVFYGGELLCQVDAPKIKPGDTVGAGDTFIAWLVAGLLELPTDLRQDREIVQSVTFDAVYAAAYNCTQTGCNPPTDAQLAEFIGNFAG